jgi:ATP-dependent DNA helicase PIF1
MDEDQKRAVYFAVTGKSFFLTGAGGTGKSYVIRSIVDALNREGKDVALTAMTGCAALLLGKGAKTLHSWAGIGLGKESADIIVSKIKKSFKAKKNWLSMDCLIIDEISMMTPDLLDKLDLIGRGIRKNMNKRPFGGLQVILVGDMYQLPPVVMAKEQENMFVFEAEVWKTVIQDHVILKTVHRQSDPVFLKILEEARAGKLSQESIGILETRRNNEWKKLEIKPTLLFTRRADVEQINMTQLKKCQGPDITFKAKTVYSPAAFAVHASEQDKLYATEKMDKNGAYVPELTLRVGAQVMLLTNKDVEHGLVNGSRGVIERFCDGLDPLPMVKFKNGEVIIIERASWASEDLEGFNREQIPLRLAYAVTIHKAQGATLDCALIDIGDNTFEYGQAYVALSRVKSLESLYIWDLAPHAFMVHPKVRDFFAELDHLPAITSAQTVGRSTAITDLNEPTNDDPCTCIEPE